ncbi:ABC transporter permease [Methanoregula sp.]|uniref:ABC transporter permease n=1 Tax=Methanoregula sp. TaxID=2052170 RepID=UPI002C027C1D|nr:ABC transporter permease [Methanoregula sp.]HVP96380.1 ABC transporter permease [Methanoregula sp.]
MDIVYLLWQRSMRQLSRSWSRTAMSVIVPFAFLILMGAGLSGVVEMPGIAKNYLLFLIPGMVAVTVMFTGLGHGIELQWDRKFGFLKAVLVAPVSRMEIVLGHTAGGATTAIIQGLVLLFPALLVGFTFPGLAGFCLAFLFMVLIAISFTTVGVVIASQIGDSEGFGLATSLVTLPVFGLSGAIFPISTLPAWVEPVTLINPLTYSVEGIRYSLTGMSQIHPAICLAVMAGFCVVTTVGGAYLFRKMR